MEAKRREGAKEKIASVDELEARITKGSLFPKENEPAQMYFREGSRFNNLSSCFSYYLILAISV